MKTFLKFILWLALVLAALAYIIQCGSTPTPTETPYSDKVVEKLIQVWRPYGSTPPASPMIVAQRAGPILEFQQSPADFQKILWIEDTCGSNYRKVECLRISSSWEPVVTRYLDGQAPRNNHWEVRFKNP